MVKPLKITVKPAGGGVLLGLMSKTRTWLLPLTATEPWLVLTMDRLLLLGLLALGRMANSPAWLSVSPGVPVRVIW
jgi:hypothetical protein